MSAKIGQWRREQRRSGRPVKSPEDEMAFFKTTGRRERRS